MIKKRHTAVRSVIRRYNCAYNSAYNGGLVTKILFFVRYKDLESVNFFIYDRKRDNKLFMTVKIDDILEENGLGYAKCVSRFFRKTSHCAGQTFYD